MGEGVPITTRGKSTKLTTEENCLVQPKHHPKPPNYTQKQGSEKRKT